MESGTNHREAFFARETQASPQNAACKEEHLLQSHIAVPPAKDSPTSPRSGERNTNYK